MQVSNVADTVTHVTMGGSESIQFGIASDAAFFNVLSNSLYSDKPLAVVRENICNAWDEHIGSDRKDTPIEITITDEHFIVKDFGRGIPHEMIGPLFATYGGTTKLGESAQTGGFGLGCKSGFAIADHFEVQSCHNGTRRIYHISKSSGEVNGLPAMKLITAIPTDETGVTVKIPISESMQSNMRHLAYKICQEGQMNALVNGNKVNPLPFDDAKHGWTMVSYGSVGNRISPIYIRYGHVVYPLDNHEEFAFYYGKIQTILQETPVTQKYNGYSRHNQRNNNWSIVFQAPADRIAVTPSRESLSMTEETIKAITELLQNFINSYQKSEPENTNQLISESVEKMVQDPKPFKIITQTERLVGIQCDHIGGIIDEYSDITRFQLATHYLKTTDDKRKDLLERLRKLADSGFGNRGTIQTFMKDLERSSKRQSVYSNHRWISQMDSDWIKRQLLAPLLSEIHHTPTLKKNAQVYLYGPNYNDQKVRGYGGAFTLASKIYKISYQQSLPYLQNYVILSHNRMDVDDRAAFFPCFEHWFSSPDSGSIVVIVPRHQERVDAMRKILTNLGYYIVDLTKRQAWESVDVKKTTPVKKPKPKKGLVQLSAIINSKGFVNTGLVQDPKTARIEKPEFIVKITDRKGRGGFGGFTPEESRAICKLFGSKGGVVTTTTQQTKMEKQGIKNLKEWLLPKLRDELITNPRINFEKSLSLSNSQVFGKLPDKRRYIAAKLKEDPFLSKELGIASQLTEDDKLLLVIWQHFMHEHERLVQRNQYAAKKYKAGPEIQAVLDHFESIKTNPELDKILVQIWNSKFIELLDIQGFSRTVNEGKLTSVEKDQAKDLFNKILKG